MTNIVYIATSLDGFIATTDGGIDWLNDIPNPEQSDFGFVEFMESIDALVMGRNSFEKVLSFGEWPYEKPVFVLSNTMKEIPDDLKGKAEVISVKTNMKDLVSDLKERGFDNLYVDGGRVIQSFLKEDLIDEMIITTVPILLGAGIPLFGPLDEHLKFDIVHTEQFNNDLVKVHYRKK
jgi:dihydrofolate reductase